MKQELSKLPDIKCLLYRLSTVNCQLHKWKKPFSLIGMMPTANIRYSPEWCISHNPPNVVRYIIKEEIQRLSEVCRRYGIPFFIDGARLGYGLEAETNDLTLTDMARLCDVFYIGGTKVGALFGEAVVILSDTLKQDFCYLMKRQGAMLAKGRLLGIQFETLFEDGLYFDISRHAVRMAMKIRDAFEAKGISFLYFSPTNQQFPVLNDIQIASLSEKYAFEYWTKVDIHHNYEIGRASCRERV